MKRAVTLIELLVTVAIFSLTMASFVGFFIYGVKVQRRVLAQREMIDSASFALDYISRSLRMAKKDDIEIRGSTKNCLLKFRGNYEVAQNQSEIKFRNHNNQCQRFFLEGGRIKEAKDNEQYFLTPTTLEITKLKFSILGDDAQDTLQPRVTIFLELQRRGQPETKISVQTTVSQRDLDF